MIVLEQPVLQRAAVPKLGADGFPGESCGTGSRRATAPVFLARAVSITGAKAGAQEASHQQ